MSPDPRPPRPIRTLLIANRGEIARRITRTARSLGMHVVAVYAEADSDAPFVREADEAVRLPGGYLDRIGILEAAALTGADAVHPGYGFLSEHAGFAAQVVEKGLVWVGPSSEVIAAVSDKVAAKQAATAAGVPNLASADDAAGAAAVGYPLLVKAAAGGGGKGMRVVHRPEELDDAMASARREAGAAFGDDRVFLERWVARARHVEIQVLGDRYGRLVHLGERECSIQRRHQKIIEESPSPALDEERRTAMASAALSLAGVLGYESAGTVEFLVDADSGEFWFLEVNTRLQVEHPVTEAVTGIDLVREQLRIAAGEPLGYDQADITLDGHAVEARLYAEDPSNEFLPVTGVLRELELPVEPVVRWDSGVERGSVVGVEFDPMLAKVIAHAPSRSEAIGRLARALERLHIGGLTTNRDFLVATLRTPELAAGDTTIDFIDRVDPPRRQEVSDEELRGVAVAAALWLQAETRRAATTLGSLPSGWRNARLPAQRVELGFGDRTVAVRYRRQRDGSFEIEPDGEDGSRAAAVVHRCAPDVVDAEWAGRRITHRVGRFGEDLYLTGPSGTVALQVRPRFDVPGATAPAGSLVAPMPGVVLEVRVAVGDSVEAGQTLVVVEAMKMEHHVRAGVDGVVVEIHVDKGQQLDNGAPLMVIEPAGAAMPRTAPAEAPAP